MSRLLGAQLLTIFHIYTIRKQCDRQLRNISRENSYIFNAIDFSKDGHNFKKKIAFRGYKIFGSIQAFAEINSNNEDLFEVQAFKIMFIIYF